MPLKLIALLYLFLCAPHEQPAVPVKGLSISANFDRTAHAIDHSFDSKLTRFSKRKIKRKALFSGLTIPTQILVRREYCAEIIAGTTGDFITRFSAEHHARAPPTGTSFL